MNYLIFFPRKMWNGWSFSPKPWFPKRGFCEISTKIMSWRRRYVNWLSRLSFLHPLSGVINIAQRAVGQANLWSLCISHYWNEVFFLLWAGKRMAKISNNPRTRETEMFLPFHFSSIVKWLPVGSFIFPETWSVWVWNESVCTWPGTCQSPCNRSEVMQWRQAHRRVQIIICP